MGHKLLKESRTSNYYGTRLDKRVVGGVEKHYYRSSIESELKKYYLGIYKTEEMAAYAFNVGFSLFSNGNYTIENHVELSEDEIDFVKKNVFRIMAKKGIHPK